jgi:hypothetical protein
VDETALRQNLQTDLNMGVVDRQTVAERLGYDWEEVSKRLEDQQQEMDNVGSMILRAFDRTGGASPNGQPANRQAIPMGR